MFNYFICNNPACSETFHEAPLVIVDLALKKAWSELGSEVAIAVLDECLNNRKDLSDVQKDKLTELKKSLVEVEAVEGSKQATEFVPLQNAYEENYEKYRDLEFKLAAERQSFEMKHLEAMTRKLNAEAHNIELKNIEFSKRHNIKE